MTEWFQAAPALIVAVAVFTLPGLPAAWLLRLRGLALVAASIAASIAVIAIASIVGPVVGMSWGPLLTCVTAGALALLILPLRFIKLPLSSRSGHRGSLAVAAYPRNGFWTAASLLLAGLLITSTVTGAIGSPENFSQTYDGVFHLNAVAHVMLSGDASPFHMDLSSPGSSGSFYPTAWHATVALVSQLSGASVPVATNVVAIATSAWIWPVAILFFSRPFFAKRPAHLMMGAVLAASFTAFPYLLLAWGALYPNLLSTALIPIALGFVYPALRPRETRSNAPLVSLWIAGAGALAAATLAHPNALFGFAVFTLPMLVVTANDIRKLPISGTAKVLRWGAIGIVVLGYITMWGIVATGDNERNTGSLTEAFLDGFSNAPMLNARAWFLTVLVIGGIVVLLVRRRHRWLILSYVLALGLFVTASAFPEPIRSLITGAWYNDAHRLASLLPIAAIPLAAIATARLVDYVTAGISQFEPDWALARIRRYLPVLGALVVFALIVTGSRGQSLAVQTGWIAELHRADGLILSQDERTLLERIPDEVPAEAVIAGDPWTGTGLALAISERGVLFGHLNGTYGSATRELASDFTSLGAAACPLLNELGVNYLLDFGTDRYSVGADELYDPYRGLEDIQSSPIVTEIDREGQAALFKVDCP